MLNIVPDPIRPILIRRGEHRLFPTMDLLTTLLAAVQIAIDCRLGHHVAPAGYSTDYQCMQFPGVAVRISMSGPVERLISGRLSSGTQLRLMPTQSPIAMEGYEQVAVTTQVDNAIIAQAFVVFFEDHVEWVASHFGGRPRLSPLWHFARILRNACSHGGKINIASSAAPSGTWRHLTYSFADAGRNILDEDLGIPDIILLMLDLSEDLDALGCPLEP